MFNTFRTLPAGSRETPSWPEAPGGEPLENHPQNFRYCTRVIHRVRGLLPSDIGASLLN